MIRSYVVIGAGISGLVAAWELTRLEPEASITVLEGSSSLGGKIAHVEVAGIHVDSGAESLLARRPEALTLIDELGLRDDIVHPASTQASIFSRGRLHPMPTGTMMGIPSDADTLMSLLTDSELARVRNERLDGGVSRDRSGSDISVGDFVDGRLGPAVVDRLIEPLLGGVYAGHAREISLAAALPTMFSAYRNATSVLEVARAAQPVADAPRPPVFASLRGGVNQMIAALERVLGDAGVTIRTNVTVREVSRRPARRGGGFQIVTGPVPEPDIVTADRLIVATPSAPTSRLLAQIAPAAARGLSEIETASMAIVTMALPSASVPTLVGSGLLVPPVEGLTVKAATFSGNKWAWVGEAGATAADPVVVLRASVGRHREESALQRDDDDLVDVVRRDLSTLLGRTVPEAIDADVHRWGGALPQYAPGHLDRVATIRSAVARVPGLAVCGATYDGVGIPACIASARAAATQVRRPQ